MPGKNHNFDPPGQTPAEKAMSDYLAGKEGWPPTETYSSSPKDTDKAIAFMRSMLHDDSRWPHDPPSFLHNQPLPDRERRTIVIVALCFVCFIAGFVLGILQ